VFVSRVQRRIFMHKRDDVNREWTNLCHEELNDLYFSLIIIWVMKSSGMMWTVHLARVGERRGV
jgi:cell division protein FtsL